MLSSLSQFSMPFGPRLCLVALLDCVYSDSFFLWPLHLCPTGASCSVRKHRHFRLICLFLIHFMSYQTIIFVVKSFVCKEVLCKCKKV